MSSLVNPGSSSIQSESKPAESRKSGRRGTLQSGFSLLARAEPQIWFTGGMLAICLAMVVSLLALILASGLPTFWPRPIDWLVLSNGSLDIGEAQSSSVASVQSTSAVESSGASPAEATPQNALGTRSHYYRTENFDLTNTHYRWFTPQELRPEGIVRVPSSVLVERYEWGHLYGIPLRIHEPIEVSEADRARIAEVTEIERTLQALLPLATSSPEGSEAMSTAVSDAMQIVQAWLVKNKSLALQRGIADANAGVVQVRLQGEDAWRSATAIDTTALESSANVEAVRQVLTDPSEVARRIEEVLPVVTAQRNRVQRLKHDLSRSDVRISKLRIGIRQAELDTKSVLPLQLDECHVLIQQRTALEQLADRVAESKLRITSLIDDPQKAEAIAKQFAEFEQKRIPSEIAAIEMQLAAWRMPLENAVQPLQEAVAAYEAGYAAVIVEKRPIEDQLAKLEEELARGELMVCVPNGAQSLQAVSREDAAKVAEGTVPTSVIERLAAVNVTASEKANSIFKDEAIALTEIVDAENSNHLLAVTAPQLLDSAETSGLSLLTEHPVAFEELVRVIPVNELSMIGKLSVYFSRWGEFLFENPREANTLGGVFPAIWGTIVMTLIMTIAVVPFGVMAALYLREYTKGGPLVSIIRISINNLAGVPSIVYGVFGFSFFCMTIGSYIDGGPRNADITVWPSGTWYLVLWITVVIGTAAFFFSFLSSGPLHSQTRLKRVLSKAAFVLWMASVVAVVALIAKSPFFDGFYAAQLPNPTFGKGGLLWASLTLALLTLPVVIVATEEALASVPNSLREGSLACGASKWQTIRRIVLPHARPGILTGAILAMARGAGEVAPLMLVGALPNAPELPLDSEFPFFHGSRNFMHLGYQIYSLGFQSQNSEAAKPMVFTCTLLLILIVAALNVVAIFLRTRLRRRFQGNQF